jgi:hypothetical protein
MLLFAGCKKENCLSKAGPAVSVTRAVSAFHEIDVYDNINVVLTQDSIETIAIDAPQHLEPNIITTVENGVLTLKNETACTWLRNAAETITINVHVKTLDNVLYAGSGHIRSANTLQADAITFYSEVGAGNIDVSLQAKQTFAYIMDENADFIFHGNTDACWSYTNSRGTIDFSDFVAKKMTIEYGSVRDGTINVSEELNAIIYYKGNLFYKGTPKITKDEIHSSGRLIWLY